jgi:hypothetical protein
MVHEINIFDFYKDDIFQKHIHINNYYFSI